MIDNFWRDLPRPFFILAPMEDVTDVVFRHVVSEAARPDVFFTEFTNTESYCHPEGNKSVRGRLTFTEDEQPIVAHIWGDKPEYFRQMSIGMAKQGFKGIDINMGCPVPNVAAKGKGSGLIRRPEVAADIHPSSKSRGTACKCKNKARLHGCRRMARLVNTYIETRHCQSFHSSSYEKGNEQSRCALGTDSGD